MFRSKFRWVLAIVLAFSTAAFFSASVSALCPGSCQYPSTGRDYFKGYYTNNNLPTNNAIPNSHGYFWPSSEAPWAVSNVNQWISFIQGSLYDTSNGSVNDHTGAASYYVNHMTGHKGTEFGGSVLNGVNAGRARFAEWSQLMRDYDAAGLVRWSDTLTQCYGDVQANMDFIAHDSFYYSNTNMPRGCYTDPSITFLDPDTLQPIFQIKKTCGNPIGENRALPPPNPPTGTLNPPTPPSGSTPPGYNTGDVNVNSSCSFITGTATDPAAPSYAVVIRVTYSRGGTTLGTDQTTASTSGAHRYSLATPNYVRESITPVTVSAVGVRSNGSTTFNLTGSPISVGPCLLANPNCGPMNVSPASLDPGTAFTVTTSVKYGSMLEAQTAQAQSDFRYFITITGPNGYSYNGNVTPTGPDPSTFTFTGAVTRPPTGAPGKYVVGWGISGSFGAVNCGSAITGNTNPPVFNVTNKPYFKVNDGDISAGAGISTGGVNCASGGVAPNQNASIASWNRGSAGSYGGAGAEFGALALNHLLGFVSGQGSSYAPSRLSFANTGAANQVNVSQELYGGKYGNTACTADYFANASNIQTGNITINGLSIANGTHQTIYVDGNVYINGNITFAGATAGYPNAAAIPSFSLVVRGNIYVAPGVTQLDGFYIAQPTSGSATNGIIYSCARSGFGTNAVNSLTSSLQSGCSSPLTVNGAFTGRQVWLLRTAGTVSGNTAAETFNYSPDVWLSTPYGNGLTPGTTDEYDSITSLPPVL